MITVLRSYEGCVIREGDQPPAFHYVVLTGEIIWITDAPPRLLRKLVAFQDVLRIDIVRTFTIIMFIYHKYKKKYKNFIIII